MANPKDAAWYGNNIASIIKPGAGNIYYVNSAANGGADANDGLGVDTAFLTIDHAIAQCSGTTHDYIFVIEHDDATETYPIEMDVNMVHLIGEVSAARPMPRLRAQADVDVIDLTAHYCEIAGLAIDNGADAYTNNLIHIVNGDANHIHHNYIAYFFWAYDCITLATNADNNLIEHNMFGAHGWANYAINIAGTCGRCVIRNNVFVLNGYDTGVRCINNTSQNATTILNNQFTVLDSAAGEAIYNTAATVRTFVDGNSVASGTVAMAFNPYRDLGTNDWGVNYISGAPSLPVTV